MKTNINNAIKNITKQTQELNESLQDIVISPQTMDTFINDITKLYRSVQKVVVTAERTEKVSSTVNDKKQALKNDVLWLEIVKKVNKYESAIHDFGRKIDFTVENGAHKVVSIKNCGNGRFSIKDVERFKPCSSWFEFADINLKIFDCNEDRLGVIKKLYFNHENKAFYYYNHVHQRDARSFDGVVVDDVCRLYNIIYGIRNKEYGFTDIETELIRKEVLKRYFPMENIPLRKRIEGMNDEYSQKINTL